MTAAAPSLLEVSGLTKTFGGAATLFSGRLRAQVVSDVSFTIRRGDVFGLIGESGSGKSTIARLVTRLVEPDSGTILFDGQDVGRLDRSALARLRRHIQIVFQDPYGSLDPRVRVGEAIAEPIRLHGLRPRQAVATRVNELLGLVGLNASHAGRLPHEFSGGQRQRIAIARALAVEPNLIVCDEPVSALDLSVQAQVINLFADLRARLGVAYLFISHDMAVIRHLATHVGVLYAGRLIETGTAARLFANPRHPYTRMLIAASPRPVAGARRLREPVIGEPPSPFALPPGCAFASRCAHVSDICRKAAPPLIGDADGAVACHRHAELPAIDPPSDDEALMSPAYRQRLGLLRKARNA